MKGDDISDRLLNFGVRILRVYEALQKSQAGKQIGLQLLRSGTSAGANYEEGRGAESRNNFIHKLGIAWKEIREAGYWLRLTHRAALIEPRLLEKILQEATELSKILASSLTTAKKKRP